MSVGNPQPASRLDATHIDHQPIALILVLELVLDEMVLKGPSERVRSNRVKIVYYCTELWEKTTLHAGRLTRSGPLTLAAAMRVEQYKTAKTER